MVVGTDVFFIVVVDDGDFINWMDTMFKYIFKESVLFEIEVSFLLKIKVVQNISRFSSAVKFDRFQHYIDIWKYGNSPG
ncbi:MAG: hypothetical protein AMR96_05665 [Candidatus Adiutrix intracellularis]|nr:MAG: hypothetical protein AMR96_05665 [Candidatus Adiutrix intracellularis]